MSLVPWEAPDGIYQKLEHLPNLFLYSAFPFAFKYCNCILFLQVEFMHNLEDKDHQYRSMLNEKLQMAEDSGLIQVYSKELGIRLAS